MVAMPMRIKRMGKGGSTIRQGIKRMRRMRRMRRVGRMRRMRSVGRMSRISKMMGEGDEEEVLDR